VPIKVQGLGINYSNPGVFRSEILIAESDPIVLNDYKEAYLDNPSKVITELNRELELRMQAQITHVKSDEHIMLHEQIMMLTRKGLNVFCYDPALSLEKRWKYSQNLAEQINTPHIAEQIEKSGLITALNQYFAELKSRKLSEAELYWFTLSSHWRLRTFFVLLMQLPFFFAGIVHVAAPYFFVKKFVERKFKRPVFWSSTKMAMLLVLMPLWNLILFWFAAHFLYLEWWLWILLFFAVYPVTLGFYLFRRNATLLIKSFRFNAQSLEKVVEMRNTLLKQMETFKL